MAVTASNITIMVRDMDISVSFYQSIGFEMKNRWGNHYAQMAASGLVIGLHPAGEVFSVTGSGSVSIGFTTDNFDEEKILLDKLSIAFTERNEEGGQFLHFKDPDQTELYFIKPKW